MKQIDRLAAAAFMAGTPFKSSNTSVKVDGDIVTMELHGNPIARREGLIMTIQTCGWQSLTTKNRLNALPKVQIFQRNFEWYLNGEAWNGSPIEIDLTH